MKNLFLIFFATFVFLIPPAFSQEGKDSKVESEKKEPLGVLSKFWLDYAIVKHSLKNDKGEFDAVLKMHETNPARLDFLGEFWWHKILRDCQARKLVDEAFSGASLDDAKERLDKKIDNCAYWIIYENWDEINITIKNAVAVERRENGWFYKLFHKKQEE